MLMRLLSLPGRLRHTPLGRSRRVGMWHARWVLLLHPSDETTVGEWRIRFDRRDLFIAKKLILYGEYEPAEMALLAREVKEGETVMDVGANIGLFTLHLSRLVGASGVVHAVEPDPDNLRLLRENVSRNRCGNVRIHDCALGVDEGSAGLYQSPTNRGNLSLAPLHGLDAPLPVQVVRGSRLLEEAGGSASVVKVDVEGYEPQVLEGLQPFRPRLILFEYHPPYIEAAGSDPLRFLKEVVGRGYRLALLEEGGEREISPEALHEQAARHWKEVSVVARFSGSPKAA
ncbi:MAG TPA: FkbM family methyltransferase [Thiotrichales bacterium]|nr:FkbM family methyltransferase [Thiotrichales bacterium]